MRTLGIVYDQAARTWRGGYWQVTAIGGLYFHPLTRPTADHRAILAWYARNQ
jgi:hypothetical protein